MNTLVTSALSSSLSLAFTLPDWLGFLPEWDSVTTALLYTAAVLCFMVGILGCVLPYPGHAFIVLGMVLWAWGASAWPGWGQWSLQAALAVLGSFTDSIFALMGAKRFGCSRAAFWCSALGMLVGMFFFPIGLFLGPFLGAFIGEFLLARRSFDASTRSGIGALLGTFVGMGAKFIVAAVMLLIFFW